MALFQVAAHSEAWHAIRAKHIGGSEIAALFGLQAEYALSHYALHLVKAGKLAAPNLDDNPRVQWGLRLEPQILQGAAAERRWRLLDAVYASDDTTPGLGASLDARAEFAGPDDLRALPGVGGPGVVQAKNVDWLVFKQSWGGEPPHAVLLQLQHELAATGYEWGVIAALVGGNDLHCFAYRARPSIISAIRERVTAFWTSVRDGVLPDVDGSTATALALGAVYKDRFDDTIDLTANGTADDIATGFATSLADKKQSDRLHDGYKNQVRALLGTHARAITAHWRINRSTNNRLTVTEQLGGPR